jgi:hypothetical protein
LVPFREVTMTTLRPVCLAPLVCLCLTASALADIPGPGPRPRPGPPHLWEGPVPKGEDPALQPPPMIDPKTGGIVAPAPTKPRRTGPFRSCGSGMGVGLAGIGLAWGLFWVGNRFAGRVRDRKDDRTG